MNNSNVVNTKLTAEDLTSLIKELYKFSVDRETIHLFKQYLTAFNFERENLQMFYLTNITFKRPVLVFRVL